MSQFKNVQDFCDQVAKVDADTFDGDARRAARNAARALLRRLETPLDTLWELTFDWPCLYACLQAAKDTGIFDRLDEDNARPKSTEELSNPMTPSLAARILRHLAAMNIVEQTGPDMWKATRHSSGYRNTTTFAPVEWSDLVSWDAARSLPKYWKSVNYKLPESDNANWQFMLGKDKTFYTWLTERPDVQECLNNLMNTYTLARPSSWRDVYPTKNLITTADAEGPILVDVGAGSGHDLMNFLKLHPETAGRLVFQDQERFVNAAPADARKGLVRMAHNFFDPQPVEGARAYFLHSILHNWPDQHGRQILSQIKKAMRKNYSTLLINDIIVADVKPDRYQTNADLIMMALFNAQERSETEWKTFLASAGFKVVKFWQHEGVHDGVVEAVPVEWD